VQVLFTHWFMQSVDFFLSNVFFASPKTVSVIKYLNKLMQIPQ